MGPFIDAAFAKFAAEYRAAKEEMRLRESALLRWWFSGSPPAQIDAYRERIAELEDRFNSWKSRGCA